MRLRDFSLGLAGLLLPAVSMADGGGSRYAGEHFSTRSPVLAQNGLAATAHPIASSIAIDILKKGGSAVDAAIAANAMLGLVEPYTCGIGGDLFAIVWDPKEKELVGYNGSGRSSSELSYEEMTSQLGEAQRIPTFGPLSISVPGAVDGWFALHERYGRLPMAEVLAPAIAYATNGIAIAEVVAKGWADAAGGFDNAEFKRVYLANGRAPKVGEIFRNPDLANAYQRISDGGRESFYEGETSRLIVDSVRNAGGYLSRADMRDHRGEWVTPVSSNYRGYDVFELPPNSQGIAALQMLNILKHYPLAKMGRDSADFWHLITEAKKLAYEDRAKFYSDPAFGDAPIEWLLSDAYADERRALIDMNNAAPEVAAGSPPPHGDTTYLVAADSDGMMVSLIQSTYWEFGSGIVADDTGFALQNRGSSFSMDPDHANVYAPGKRPFHTIIPAFLMKDDEPVMAFGVMGGALQPQGHVQILINMIDFGMNVQEAGDAARVYHSSESQPVGGHMRDGGTIKMEGGINTDVADELRSRGHTVVHGERGFVGAYGGYQAVWRDPETGVYHGATEMRYDGAAAGY